MSIMECNVTPSQRAQLNKWKEARQRIESGPWLEIHALRKSLQDARTELELRRAEVARLQQEALTFAEREAAVIAEIRKAATVKHKPDEAEPLRNTTAAMRLIIKETAEHFGLTVLDLLSQRRTHNLTTPRHICAYLCKTLTGNSFPQVGRAMGGRDHTTVMHSVEKINERIRFDLELASHVATIGDIVIMRTRVAA